MTEQHASPGGSVSPPCSSWQNPEFWGKIGVPPGGHGGAARRFLGENPELCRNSATRKGVHAIRFIQGTVYWTRLKTSINNSPYLDSLLNSNWYVYPSTKTLLAFAFHSKPRSFSLTSPFNQHHFSRKPLAKLDTKMQHSLCY